MFWKWEARPILRSDIGRELERAVSARNNSVLAAAPRSERAALLGSLGGMYTAGAEINWRGLFPSRRRRPSSFPALSVPEAKSLARFRARSPGPRLGTLVHPLLGDRVGSPKPSWQGALDTADLNYLTDHRLGRWIVFPGAAGGMALATARETLRPGTLRPGGG